MQDPCLQLCHPDTEIAGQKFFISTALKLLIFAQKVSNLK